MTDSTATLHPNGAGVTPPAAPDPGPAASLSARTAAGPGPYFIVTGAKIEVGLMKVVGGIGVPLLPLQFPVIFTEESGEPLAECDPERQLHEAAHRAGLRLAELRASGRGE